MKSLKSSRLLSFISVFVVYLLASVVGIISFNKLPFDIYINLLLADTIATIIVFVFSLIFKNASVYDPYWSVQPLAILIGLSFSYKLNITSILFIVVILFWGIRLTVNWAYTFNGLNHQDWRYTMLKEKTKVFYPFINFIGIHYVPTIIVYFVTMPAVYVLVNNLNLNIYAVIFLLVSVVATFIEMIADIQMQKYRKNRTTKFIRVGLWKYSRHPNYLGEILMWWGIGLACVVLDINHFYLLGGALLNTLLFIFVSIPMAEKRQSRKEGFQEYKKETRIILPLKK